MHSMYICVHISLFVLYGKTLYAFFFAFIAFLFLHAFCLLLPLHTGCIRCFIYINLDWFFIAMGFVSFLLCLQVAGRQVEWARGAGHATFPTHTPPHLPPLTPYLPCLLPTPPPVSLSIPFAGGHTSCLLTGSLQLMVDLTVLCGLDLFFLERAGDILPPPLLL